MQAFVVYGFVYAAGMHHMCTFHAADYLALSAASLAARCIMLSMQDHVIYVCNGCQWPVYNYNYACDINDKTSGNRARLKLAQYYL